jgi:hypothetical protein
MIERSVAAADDPAGPPFADSVYTESKNAVLFTLRGANPSGLVAYGQG